MDKNKSIETLQYFITGLSNGAFVHKVQGQILNAAGFTKLGKKYTTHYDEEMGWVAQFIDRLLDLGGEVKVEDRPAVTLVSDPVQYIKCDLQRQTEGVEMLRKCVAELHDDPTTYDIMKAYLKDEEEDQYWSETALDVINKIGEQNWLLTQL
ncbi:MAG: bacterioferritin (cytochrome b1) [Bacteroides sp.]|nr:bacterioferritin (cytochrome b1) [Bacteroides sp.]